MSSSRERIGLIAGSGSLAREFATRAREKGCEVALLALSPEIYDSLENFADKIVQVAPTQPKKIASFFRSEGVRRVALVGKVEKKILFQGLLKFDLEALRFMTRAKDMADMTIMNAVAELAERNGLEIIPQAEFLDHIITPSGPIGKRGLKDSELKDARYAFRMAREVAALDIGQTIVVRGGAVIAVEGIEGTDETIRRGCALAGGKGAIVCKVARPNQDPRFDVPVVGPGTLDAAREGGATALIVEAGTTFLLDKESLVGDADAAGIALFGWRDDGER